MIIIIAHPIRDRYSVFNNKIQHENFGGGTLMFCVIWYLGYRKQKFLELIKDISNWVFIDNKIPS